MDEGKIVPGFGVIRSVAPSRNGKGEPPPLPTCARCKGGFASYHDWTWGPGGEVVHADPGQCIDNVQGMYEP